MSKDLVVAILVPVLDQNGRFMYSIGTGCAVGEGQILTARHVVRPSQPRDRKRKVRVCWYHQDDSCRPAEKAVEVEDDAIWWCEEGDGAAQDNGPDVALIDCPRHGASRHIRSPRLAPDWPAVGSWSSRGFPMVALSESREHFDFDGTITDHASTDTELTLRGMEGTLAKTAEQAVSDWSGASGMPVFSGGQIVGVITNVIADVIPPQYLAVPTALLLARDDFRARYRRAEQEDLIEVGRKLVVELLQLDDAVLAAFAKHLLPNSSSGVASPSQIADQVLTMPIETLIDRALVAQYDLQRTRQYRAADLIAQLVQVALPVSCDLSDIREAHEISATAACCLIPARSSSVTLTEVIMAGADRRGARFWPQLDLDAWPRGLGCIGHLPEGGRDRSGDQAVRDLTGDLGDIFESRFDDNLEPSFRDYLRCRFGGRWREIPADLPPEQAKQHEEELIVWIRKEVARKASYEALSNFPYGGGYSFYLVAETPRGMDDEARAARDAVLLRLKQTFPEIAVLTLAPEPFDSWKELEPYSKLRDLLYSANQEPR